MIPIRYILLEGPDCCGKSTLFNAVHKHSKFKYNIHDRSFLSMLCYAKLYGRDETFYRNSLKDELCDGNNFMVVLMPSKATILGRLSKRGDEFQDAVSIDKLYDIFADEVKNIQDLPNVFISRSDNDVETLANIVVKNVSDYENFTPALIGAHMKMWTKMSVNDEVQFKVHIQVPESYNDIDILEDKHEGEYYKEILDKCFVTIQNEISGKNPYGKTQDLESRRFYYSSDSCISSIHFLPRNEDLKVICTLRSTNARKNGSIDTRFLAHLSTCIPKTFNWPVKNIHLYINFNSIHIRQDAF